MNRSIQLAAIGIVSAFAVASPAVAGMAPGAPAPVLGLGIPALALFGYAYHRLARRNEK